MPKRDIQYARVMHHIGGLTGANDNSDMIRGGEDTLTLISQGDLPPGTDVDRLVRLGAIREATEPEIKQWEVKQGIRDADPDDPDFTALTTGLQGMTPEEGGATGQHGTQATGDKPAGAGAGEDGKPGKGELSELTVPQLKEMAKDAGIEGYNSMNKDDLLDALTAPSK